MSIQSEQQNNNSRVYLRGVDIFGIVEKYINGEYRNLKEQTKVELREFENNREDIITIKDNINNSYQIDMCGQKFACIGYKVFSKDGKYGVIDPCIEYNCMYCLRKIKDRPLGIPIKREERRGEDGNIKIYYHMIDIFCTFNCWKAEIKKRLQNVLYSQSMVYASEIYNKCTGKDFSNLSPASDQRLLKIFNGPMTWKEFHSDTFTYNEKPGNIYFLPIIEYLEQTS